jgi:archaemetzincin
VFGLANKELGCGIFSFRRYYDEIEENFGSGNYAGLKFLDVVTKLSARIMLHETGHLFALKHCIYFKCLLNGSNHMGENFKKPFELCPVCLRKIWGNLKFDIIKRFENLVKDLTK